MTASVPNSAGQGKAGRKEPFLKKAVQNFCYAGPVAVKTARPGLISFASFFKKEALPLLAHVCPLKHYADYLDFCS
jgi:hypothetical protein